MKSFGTNKQKIFLLRKTVVVIKHDDESVQTYKIHDGLGNDKKTK